MDKQIIFLKTIHDNPHIKNKIEKFIKEKDFVKKTIEKSGKDVWSHQKQIATAFANLQYSLSEDIDPEVVYFFFSLDKKLYPKIYSVIEHNKNNELYIKVNDRRRERIDGEVIMSAYKRNYTEIIRFLEDNVTLLPVSTKNYVLKQMEKPIKQIKFKEINDLFAAKTFENTLSNIPDYVFLEKNLATFNNIHNINQRTKSLTFFLESINIKYKPDERLSKIKKNILMSIERDIENIFKWNIKNTETLYSMNNLSELLENNEEIIDFLFERKIVFRKATKILYYLSNFTQKEKNTEIINNFLANKHSKKDEGGNVKFILHGKEATLGMLLDRFNKIFHKHNPENIKKELLKRGANQPLLV